MDNPPDLSPEEVIHSISIAFGGVNRYGGISWSQTVAIGGQEGDRRRFEARAKDTDHDWHELVYDANWRPDCTVGGWGFLDPISFRYYLPAAMTRCVNSGEDEGIVHHLILDPPPEEQRGWLRRALRWPNVRERTLKRWSGLNLAQQRCIRDFLRYMAATDKSEEVWAKFRWSSTWAKALASYWDSVK